MGQKKKKKKLPQNALYLTYVPQVPHVGYIWGTDYTPPQDGLKGSKIDVKHVKIVEIYRILTAPRHHGTTWHQELALVASFMLYSYFPVWKGVYLSYCLLIDLWLFGKFKPSFSALPLP